MAEADLALMQGVFFNLYSLVRRPLPRLLLELMELALNPCHVH